MIQKAFKIGNSTAVTIPKKTNIKPGTKLKVSKVTKKQLVYDILEENTTEIENYIRDVSGGFDLSDKINQEDLMKQITYLEKHPYEKL
ncbi:hypothetical protein JXA34_00190 [Patescibacteria group bacterium]|nr:hypothetical protein [Patescibacteria group bacterium]